MQVRRLINMGRIPALLLLGGWFLSDAAEASLPAEHYRLVQVNGRPLPFLMYAVEDDCEADLVGGTLELDSVSGRYVLVSRVREQCAWTAPEETEERDSGRYEIDARQVRFRSDHPQSPNWLGWAKGNTVELVRGGRAYTYRR